MNEVDLLWEGGWGRNYYYLINEKNFKIEIKLELIRVVKGSWVLLELLLVHLHLLRVNKLLTALILLLVLVIEVTEVV